MAFQELFASGAGAPPGYEGYKPTRKEKKATRQYGRYQKADIDRLYSDKPFAGPGLGFSDDILEKIYSRQRGSRAAEQQELFDRYGRSPYGTQGREYQTAAQGVSRAQAGEDASTAANVEIMGEQQKRKDLYGRLGKTAGAYQQGVDMWNQWANQDYQAQMAKHESRKERYGAVGGLIDTGINMAAAYYTGGMVTNIA